MTFDCLDPEFIDRCNKWASPLHEDINQEWKKNHSIRCIRYNRANPEKIIELRNKYQKSEQGRIASRKRTAIYNRRIRELAKMLDDQEKEAIRMFYVNCPSGYEVDHIIPISKGGKHHITNLQYLTKAHNRSKRNKLDWKPENQTQPALLEE